MLRQAAGGNKTQTCAAVTRTAATIAAAAVAALLAAPSGAAAATPCELASGVLDVTMSANNDTETSVASGEISVSGSVGPVTARARRRT